jgi:Kef-type K+ transport system membrane component KefB
MPSLIPLLSAAAPAGHGDAVASVILALAVILAAAKLAGDLATRVGQPAVLGELVAGVVLGNMHWLGVPWVRAIAADPTVDVLAQLGVLILLFQVGIESTVRDMLKVGLPSLLVAVLGVVTPFALGWGVGAVLLPGQSRYTYAFLGATLTATSVGITTRVLGDLGKSRSAEARIILGAAVVDDVLGLVILAIVGGAIQAANLGAPIAIGSIVVLVLKALLFLGGALALGVALSPHLFRLASDCAVGRARHGIGFCFTLAYLSSAIGLAPIVGAYAAGLILEDLHSREFTARGEHDIEELIQPVAELLVPIFFVLMGMRVDLAAFARADVLGLATLLTLAAVLGKQACSL